MNVEDLELSEEPEAAAVQYVRLRRYATRILYAFLQNLGSQLLRQLEHQFNKSPNNVLSVSVFIRLCFSVFSPPDSQLVPLKAEREFIIATAALMLFQDIDMNNAGTVSWIQYVEYVIAKSEAIRRQAAEATFLNNRFPYEKSPTQVSFRPEKTKCYFNKVHYWPKHPFDAVVVFEEGQEEFHLHRPTNLQRRRKCGGHRGDVLAAEFIGEPYNWIVTGANDKMLTFWNSDFNRIMQWNLDRLGFVAGCLQWCPEVSALYAADHSSMKTGRVEVWRLGAPMQVKVEWEKDKDKMPKTDNSIQLRSGHTKPVTCMLWLNLDQVLITGSLDTTIKIFDLVQPDTDPQRLRHTLRGHARGVTALEYNPPRAVLLSAGFDHFIKMWDAGAGTCVHTMDGHDHSIVAMCAVPQTDDEILSLDSDGVLKLWDLKRLEYVQSFQAGDPQLEKAGEIEALEPRHLCMLERDRFVVSGRRLVHFVRDASDPRLTADTPVTAIAFISRKMEIATPVRKSVRIWSALSGKLLTVHENITESNVTAVSFGLLERRLFVGAEKGEINVLNYSSGEVLKSLVPHSAEVSQIVCSTGKVLTLSTADKMILVHDDTHAKKASIMKKIRLDNVGPVLCFDSDNANMIAASSEDGVVYWYNIDSAKMISSSDGAPVKHEQAASCCRYLATVPLIATADHEGRLLFWSVQPLRPYDVFCEARLNFTPTGPYGPGSPKGEPQTYSVTCISLSTPKETHLLLGTDSGIVACICVEPVIEAAVKVKKEILAFKAAGDSDPELRNPLEAPHVARVIELPSVWVVPKAHRGLVDGVTYCAAYPPKVLSLGSDFCVRLWCFETGDALGTLEQGTAEGLAPRLWKWTVDGHQSAALDCKALTKAMGRSASRATQEEDAAHDDLEKSKRTLSAAFKLEKSESMPNLGKRLREKRGRNGTTMVPDMVGRLMPTRADDWYAGPMAQSEAGRGGTRKLPTLESGLRRPQAKDHGEMLKAAKRLSGAFAEFDRLAASSQPMLSDTMSTQFGV